MHVQRRTEKSAQPTLQTKMLQDVRMTGSTGRTAAVGRHDQWQQWAVSAKCWSSKRKCHRTASQSQFGMQVSDAVIMYESAKTPEIYNNTFNALRCGDFEISKFEIPISKLPRRIAKIRKNPQLEWTHVPQTRAIVGKAKGVRQTIPKAQFFGFYR
jgi:hypothetical protein